MAKAPCRTNVTMYSADCDTALVLSSYLLLRAAFLRAVGRHKIQNLCSLVLGETMAPLAALVRFPQNSSVIKGYSYAKSGSTDDLSGSDRRRRSPAPAGAASHSQPRARCRRRLR